MTKLETLEKQKQKAEDRLADYMSKAKKVKTDSRS